MTDYKDLLKTTIFETIQHEGWIQFESSKSILDKYIEVTSVHIKDFNLKQKINFELAIPYRLPPGEKPGYCKSVVDDIKRKMIELSFVSEEDQGGAQTYRALGSWVNNHSELEQDECLILYTAIPIFKWESSITILRDIIKNDIQTKLQQKCVFMRINCETWGKPINLMEQSYVFAEASEFGGVDTRCFNNDVNDYENLEIPETNKLLISVEIHGNTQVGNNNQQTNIGEIKNTNIDTKFFQEYGNAREEIGRMNELNRIQAEKLRKFESSNNADEKTKIAEEVQNLDIFRDVANTQKPDAKTLIELGEVSEYLCNFIVALGHYNAALRKYKAKRDDLGIAKAEVKIASITLEENPSRAKELLQTCIVTAQVYQDKELEAEVSTLLGNMLANEAKFEQAIHFHNRTKEIYEETNEHYAIAVPKNNIAVVYSQMGQTKIAAEMYRECYELDKKYASMNFPLAALNYGNQLFDMFRFEESEEIYRDGLKFAEKYGSRVKIAKILIVISGLEWELGRYHDAEKTLKRAERLMLSTGKQLDNLYNHRHRRHKKKGQYEQAMENLLTAKEVSLKANDVVSSWSYELDIADILRIQGNLERSTTITKDIIRKARNNNAHGIVAEGLSILYLINMHKENYDLAEKVINDIIKLEKDRVKPNDDVVNQMMLCDVYIAQERFIEAESTIVEYENILKNEGYTGGKIRTQLSINEHKSSIALSKNDLKTAELTILDSINNLRSEFTRGNLLYDKEILSRIYFKKGKIEEALETISEAVEQAHDTDNLVGELFCLKTMLKLQTKSNQNIEATAARIKKLKQKMGING